MKLIALIIIGLLMGVATVLTGSEADAIYISILKIFFNISPAVSRYLHAKSSNVNFKISCTMLA
jgi:hypothetical protein